MIIGRLMRDEDALLQFEVMSWLIRRYGPPKNPKVPSPLHKPKGLSDMYWEAGDTRTVCDWAQDSFGLIKNECGMDDWSIQIAPHPNEVYDKRHMQFAQSWNMDSKEPYYVDGYGRPIIHYDSLDCEEPGCFAARIIMKLAEIKLMNFVPEQGLSPMQSGIITLTAMCYMRQGFTMAALPEAISQYFMRDGSARSMPIRLINNTMAFSSCLALLSRKQSPEQIVATYGALMSKGFRKKIRPACKQISDYKPEVEILRLLANPTCHNFESRSYAAFT